LIEPGSVRSGSARPTALVTGASGAIGSEIAAQLAGAGYALVLQYRSDAAGAEALAERLRASGAEVTALAADLDSEADAARLVADVEARFGSLECLVHAASPPIRPEPALLVPDEAFLQHLSVHALAFARLARGIVPLLQRRQRGVLVGLLSTVLEPVRPKRWWPYTSAKFALWGLLSGLASDLEGSGVRTVGVMPGGVATALSRDAGVAQQGLLTPVDVAALVRRVVAEPQVFPNGALVRIEPGKIEVGKLVFAGGSPGG
jgi:3-oxoacyl-[acyl-carrier protein] reductase